MPDRVYASRIGIDRYVRIVRLATGDRGRSRNYVRSEFGSLQFDDLFALGVGGILIFGASAGASYTQEGHKAQGCAPTEASSF